ncbi:MAG: cobalamin B12-binding domain-containing protein [Sphingomonadaceae bacterium]|nr:cobalamin B12-binding domain-containing protein [Sphingomonadaceae bacterium]
MATVFGISGLKSRLDGWRGSRKNTQAPELAMANPGINPFTIVKPADDGLDISLLLENLVIPKLIAHQHKRDAVIRASAFPSSDHISTKAPIDSADVDEFARISVSDEAHALMDFVDQRLANGSSVEALYVELLAPAARRLGEYWEMDSEDFVGVTMGLWRIQEVLRELTTRIPPKSRSGQGQRSALFSMMPGEQHSFGTLMVAECFQRAGWDADVLIEPSKSQLTGKFANHRYDLIGLTVSQDCSTATLGSMVKTIKAVSNNPHVRIMLGGRVINEQPELVDECGADATAVDAISAVALADRLVPVKWERFEHLT